MGDGEGNEKRERKREPDVFISDGETDITFSVITGPNLLSPF